MEAGEASLPIGKEPESAAIMVDSSPNEYAGLRHRVTESETKLYTVELSRDVHGQPFWNGEQALIGKRCCNLEICLARTRPLQPMTKIERRLRGGERASTPEQAKARYARRLKQPERMKYHVWPL